MIRRKVIKYIDNEIKDAKDIIAYHEKKRKLWEDSLDSLLDVKAVLKQEKGK